MFAEWIKICFSESKNKHPIDENKKAYYKNIFGKIYEVEVISRKSIYYIDFQYRTYEYLIRFKNGKLKIVNENKLMLK